MFEPLFYQSQLEASYLMPVIHCTIHQILAYYYERLTRIQTELQIFDKLWGNGSGTLCILLSFLILILEMCQD